MSRQSHLALVSTLTSLQPVDRLVLHLDWATAEEKRQIIEWNLRDGRQTMNLRTMPTAQLIVIKHGTEIVGWTGFDLDHNPKYPELFSLYLSPAFKDVPDLGLALSHIKYSYLISLGLTEAYGRVQVDKNDARLDFRIKLGINKLVDPAQHPAWASMCKNCELFGKTCTQQAYFTIHLQKLADMARIKLGSPQPPFVPSQIEVRLRDPNVKSMISNSRYKVRWVA